MIGIEVKRILICILTSIVLVEVVIWVTDVSGRKIFVRPAVVVGKNAFEVVSV